MRIVIQNSAHEIRGNEKIATVLGHRLQDRGHRVVVSCHPRGTFFRSLEERGIPYDFCRPGGDFDAWNALRFSRWLASERTNAVLLTTWKRVPWAAWAARRARVGRIVVRLGIERSPPTSWRYRLALRRWVDALVVNAPEIRDLWLQQAPWFPAERIHLVLNGIPPLPRVEPGRLRAELEIPAEVPVLVAAGGLEQRKGFDLLLDALPRLSDPGARLVIAGSGPQEGALRAQAEGLGVGGRVHFLGWRSDISEVLADGDLFVLSSRREGMAVAMLEAMSAGVPVVAARVGGVDEALAAGGGRGPAGWIVPPEDAGALAAGVNEALAALRQGPDAEKRREEALFRARNWFTEEQMVTRVEEILRGDGRG